MSARARALGLCVLLTLLAAGCSRDIASVELEEMRDCLSEKGQSPRSFAATGAGIPRTFRTLARAGGARGALATLGRAGNADEAWGYLFFYSGSKRAERIYNDLRAADSKFKVEARRSGRPTTVPTTRKQNVIVVFGSQSTYGRRAARGERRVLKSCFDRAV